MKQRPQSTTHCVSHFMLPPWALGVQIRPATHAHATGVCIEYYTTRKQEQSEAQTITHVAQNINRSHWHNPSNSCAVLPLFSIVDASSAFQYST